MTDMPGQVGFTDFNNPANMQHFHQRMLQARVRTAVLVKVKNVTAGKYNPHSYSVDVQPLVNQVDGGGQSQAHGTVYNLPVLSGSGGNGAVIVKPAKNDLGVIIVLDRDSSSAINSNAPANPGSKRMHDFADGIYLGGFFNQNNASHWIVGDENGWTINGNLTITGNVTASGEVVAKNSIHLSTHTHPDAQGGNTGSPNAGS